VLGYERWPLGGCHNMRKGLEGCEAVLAHGHLWWPCAGTGARERGVPQSPVFGAAENAPK
jgi:hypothetical protein